MRFLCHNVLPSFFIGGCWLGATFFSPIGAQPMLYSVLAHTAQATGFGENHRHPLSVIINPAAIAGFRKIAWAFAGEQRFLAPGWTGWAATAVVPVSSGSWSFMWAQEGLPATADQLGMITHAKAVSKQALIGISLGINRKKVGSFNTVITPAIAAGFTFSLSSEWQTDVSYSQFMGQRASYRLPGNLFLLRYRLSYHPSDKVALVSGVTKETGRIAAGSAAICYRPTPKAAFRIGCSGAPTLYWFGCLLGIGKKVVVQVHSGFYPLVGVSNGMSIYSDPTINRPDPSFR